MGRNQKLLAFSLCIVTKISRSLPTSRQVIIGEASSCIASTSTSQVLTLAISEMHPPFYYIKTGVWYISFPLGEKILIGKHKIIVYFFLFPSFLSFSFLQIFMNPIYEAQVLS